MNRKQDYDSYEIEEPSDEERASSSSEDELDILLNGTPEQKKKLLREYLTGESESSSCDEFEKEMEAELTTTMNSLEGNWAAPLGQAGVSTGTSGGSNPSGTQPQQVYDSIYFDSDDSDSDQEGKAGSSKSQRKKKHVIPTNDELLYDPDEDDRDQAWADAKRRRYSRCQATAGRHGMRSQTLPSSDAVLNCPSCMTTLCLDCQRHDKYRTQYRAMFVMNCEVNKEEILRYKVPQRKQKKPKQTRKKRRHDQMDAQPEAAQSEAAEPGTTDSRLGGMDEGEIYHPVLCTECSTEVAVYDKDEVYHFFNILASHS